MQKKTRKCAVSMLVAVMMALSLFVGAIPAVAAETLQTTIHNVSNFGDWYWYYGRTNNEFLAESLDMSATNGWTYAQTAIGFGAAGGRDQDGVTWNGSLTTTIPSGSGSAQRGSPLHTWTYMKKTFELPTDFDVDDIIDVSGIHRIDDALVILINGVQVYRYNTNNNSREVMSEAINWGVYTLRNTDACNRPFTINNNYDSRDTGFRGTSSPSELYDAASFTNLKAALKPGANVITCMVGNRNSSSSDLWFDLQMNITVTSGESGGEPTEPTPQPLSYEHFVMSPGSSQSELGFTWTTTQATGKLAIRAAGTVEFTEYNTVNTQNTTSRAGRYFHKATAVGLLPSTTYEYKLIGANGDESDIFTVKTGDSKNFSFFAGGDIQVGSSGNRERDRDGWNNSLNIMTANFPNALFFMSAGDQVETASNVTEYNYLTAPEKLKSIPFAPAVGNHDSGNRLFRDHFNLPNTYAPGTGAASTDYWYRYGEVLFIVLDSNTTSMSAARRANFESAINANLDAKWKIVMHHHAPYSVYRANTDSTKVALINNVIPVYDEFKIDAVINGHCHSYARSYQMIGDVPRNADQQWLDADGNIVSDSTGKLYNTVLNPTGTVYFTLNSTSGSKYYSPLTERYHSAVYNQASRPNFSVADVTEKSFTFTTYQVNTNGSITEIDSYTIIKAEEDIIEPVLPVDLILATDKNIVRPDEYFNVSVSFPEEIESNIVKLDFAFDSGKFDFAGYTPATGATLLTREYGLGYASVMVMLPDYAMESLGSVMLKANPGVGISSSAISGVATFVERDGNFEKAIKEATGSYIQKTNNAGTEEFVVDMIVLSNLIDAFGMTSDHTDWDEFSHFDFNGNGMIDIYDIVTVAQMIK